MAFQKDSLAPVKMKLDNAFQKVDGRRFGRSLAGQENEGSSTSSRPTRATSMSGIKRPHSSSTGGRNSFGGRNSMGGRESYIPSASKKSVMNQQNMNSAVKRSAQRSASFDGKRMSTANKTSVTKDPRPIRDSAFREQSSRLLIEFLSNRNYPTSVSLKMLKLPSTRLILEIFEFMYGILTPNYQLGNQPEKEIPAIFQSLGYPYQITKSVIVTSGNPHMLAALSWLRNLIEFYSSSLQNCFDKDKTLFFNYTTQCYQSYLAGAESFTEHDESLERAMTTTDDCDSPAMKQQLTGEAELDAELKMLLEKNDQLDGELSAEQKTMQGLKSDINAIDGYYKKCENRAREITSELHLLQQQNQSTEESIKTLEVELAVKKEQIANQPYTQSEIDQAKKERSEIKQEQQSLEVQIKELDKRTFQMQMNKAVWTDEKHTMVLNCNEALQMILQKLPHDITSVDLELTGGENDHKRYNSVIYPELIRLKQLQQQQAIQTKKVRYEHEEEYEKLMNLVGEQKSALEELDEQIQQQEKKSQEKIKLRANEMSLLQTKLHEATEQLDFTKSKRLADHTSLKQKIQQAKEQLEAVESKQQLEAQKYETELKKVEQSISQHKANITKRIWKFHLETKENSERIQELLKDDPLQN